MPVYFKEVWCLKTMQHKPPEEILPCGSGDNLWVEDGVPAVVDRHKRQIEAREQPRHRTNRGLGQPRYPCALYASIAEERARSDACRSSAQL